MARRLPLSEYERGVREGDRGVLARAITLIESRRADDGRLAQDLLQRLLPLTGGALRVGISGPPGVGKSTFLDALGMHLIELGHRPAVLAVDPSSALTGGSILGDKTRMARLALDPRAFIRPSPAARTLGGVARRTRETLLLCEAAGFDVVLVETVGVGQSEVAVADLVDCFVVLAQPGAGDELQGIKKGILEMADLLAVNKADGDNVVRARSTLRDLTAALRYLTPRHPGWKPRALAMSALTGDGIPELWAAVLEYRTALDASGELAKLRSAQARAWLWSLVRERLLQAFRDDPLIQGRLPAVERAVAGGAMTPTAAAWELLATFGVEPRD